MSKTGSHRQTVQQLERLPWVVSVRESDRPNSTHYVRTRSTVIEMDGHVSAIEETGADVTAISTVEDYMTRIYVSVTEPSYRVPLEA